MWGSFWMEDGLIWDGCGRRGRWLVGLRWVVVGLLVSESEVGWVVEWLSVRLLGRLAHSLTH